MNNIIQWNCWGLKVNFIEITLLVEAFLPIAFCLQETHLSDNINLKIYSVYSTYVDEDERAVGGSTILVQDNILHSYVNLNTDLQAVAVRITLDKTITLCSVYISPHSSLSLTQLKNLSDQLPTPFIIMGDFNGHNPLWGSKTTTDKGKKLEDFLSQEGLCIFNDGT
jgi:exonuclease III